MTLFELTEFTVASGLYKDPVTRVDAAGNSSADDDTMQAIHSRSMPHSVSMSCPSNHRSFRGLWVRLLALEESWTGGEKSGGKSGTHTSMGEASCWISSSRAEPVGSKPLWHHGLVHLHEVAQEHWYVGTVLLR